MREGGRRAFIICNGPSLKYLDLTKLKNEVTFGCNTIYRYHDRMGFHTTYYFNIDSLIALLTIKESLEYISHDDVIAGYFNPYHRKYINGLKCRYLSKLEMSLCHTVGMAMIWKALQLGYEPIYVIGLDLEYNYPPKEELIKCNSIEDIPCDDDTKKILIDAKSTINFEDVYLFPDNVRDTSHMIDEYSKYKIPIHYDTTENVLKQYKMNFDRMPIELKKKIYNAGVGGNFNFVKRVDYESLF